MYIMISPSLRNRALFISFCGNDTYCEISRKVDNLLNNPSTRDIKAIEQKAAQDHKEAEKARTAVQDVLLQKLTQSQHQSKKENNE
jgi:hypothetical protein